jgi:hypothetical protein
MVEVFFLAAEVQLENLILVFLSKPGIDILLFHVNCVFHHIVNTLQCLKQNCRL